MRQKKPTPTVSSKKMPKGLDTMITDDGAGMSQGQKQLLCITRVMLHVPEMLILDEATSSIDTRTEQRIQNAFATSSWKDGPASLWPTVCPRSRMPISFWSCGTERSSKKAITTACCAERILCKSLQQSGLQMYDAPSMQCGNGSDVSVKIQEMYRDTLVFSWEIPYNQDACAIKDR